MEFIAAGVSLSVSPCVDCPFPLAQSGKTPLDVARGTTRQVIEEFIKIELPRRARIAAIIGFRRAHEAHRDASLVFRAAAEDRPLELQKRLVLGAKAGGISKAGNLLPKLWKDVREALGLDGGNPADAHGWTCGPLVAAIAGGNDRSLGMLLEAIDSAPDPVGALREAVQESTMLRRSDGARRVSLVELLGARRAIGRMCVAMEDKLQECLSDSLV